MDNHFDHNLRDKAIGFLVWFRNQYGIWTADSYHKMAEKYGHCNYGTCRNLLLELVNAGYITVWNDKTRKRRFYINKAKYNELTNPYIFHTYDTRSEGSK